MLQTEFDLSITRDTQLNEDRSIIHNGYGTAIQALLYRINPFYQLQEQIMNFHLVRLSFVFILMLSIVNPCDSKNKIELPTSAPIFNIALFNQHNPNGNTNTSIYIKIDDTLTMTAIKFSDGYYSVRLGYIIHPSYKHGYSVASEYYLSGNIKNTYSLFDGVQLSSRIDYDESGQETGRQDFIKIPPADWLAQFEVVLKDRYAINMWEDPYHISDISLEQIEVLYSEDSDGKKVVLNGYNNEQAYFQLRLWKNTFEEVSWFKMTPYYNAQYRKTMYERQSVR